jgi:hypothetical protein
VRPSGCTALSYTAPGRCHHAAIDEFRVLGAAVFGSVGKNPLGKVERAIGIEPTTFSLGS